MTRLGRELDSFAPMETNTGYNELGPSNTVTGFSYCDKYTFRTYTIKWKRSMNFWYPGTHGFINFLF